MDYMKQWLLAILYSRRELRAGLKGFYIFLACLVLGVSAITGIQSLSRGLVESLHYDGRYILGGDIALRTIYEPATPEQQKFLKQKMGPLAIVMETRAMARRADGAAATLAEVKAVDLFYPLYGTFELVDENGKKITTPMQDLLVAPIIKGVELDDWGAFVEKDIFPRLKVKMGDWIYLGQKKFQIRGIIAKEPDRVGSMRFSLAPRVMISRAVFDQTGLRTLGSQVYYDHKILMPYVKNAKDLAAAEKKIADAFPDAKWKGRDFLNASPQVERMIDRLTVFLTLIGLTTLLVGGVGISNAVRSFLETKLPNIATFKCLGAPQKFVFRVYILQIFMLATLGIIAGVLLGIGGSQIAGSLLTAKLSLSNKIAVYPDAILLATAFGYLTTLCFSLWPIGRAATISPTALFRDLITPHKNNPSLNIMVSILIAAQTLILLAIKSSSDERLAVWFCTGAIIVFAVFYGYAELMKAVMKRLKLPTRPEIRMAMANLYRPANASTSIILSLGLGLTVLVAVTLVQYNFSRLLKEDLAVDSPSFFFLDIQPDQQAAFKSFLEQQPTVRGLQMTPSLRGRITAVNGKKAEEALVDKSESWVISSDRGFTYTGELPAYSRITAGKWWDKDYKGEPIVSIATAVAKAFNIGVGDKITVSILGMEITATVANVREVDWASFTMNFAVTFAPGLLEKAPANFIGTVIVDKEQEEPLQTAIAQKFPNITSVRVKEALDTAQTLVRAISQAVKISAGVSLLAGALVLSGGIAAARRRHLYDAVILKVLGATRLRILKTFLIEYALLGILTVLIAAGLGTIAAWAVQTYIMHLDWKFSGLALVGVTLLCLGMTLLAGFLGTWRALRQKPALYLRNQ